MRVLLDENLPIDLGPSLVGHQVDAVSALGWEGVMNGELLKRMTGRFEALLTMDTNLEFQQAIAKQAFGVVLIRARSNRMLHLAPLCHRFFRLLRGYGRARFAELAPNTRMMLASAPGWLSDRALGVDTRGPGDETRLAG